METTFHIPIFAQADFSLSNHSQTKTLEAKESSHSENVLEQVWRDLLANAVLCIYIYINIFKYIFINKRLNFMNFRNTSLAQKQCGNT